MAILQRIQNRRLVSGIDTGNNVRVESALKHGADPKTPIPLGYKGLFIGHTGVESNYITPLDAAIIKGHVRIAAAIQSRLGLGELGNGEGFYDNFKFPNQRQVAAEAVVEGFLKGRIELLDIRRDGAIIPGMYEPFAVTLASTKREGSVLAGRRLDTTVLHVSLYPNQDSSAGRLLRNSYEHMKELARRD